MTEPIAEHLTSRTASSATGTGVAAIEPPWALLVGGIAGALGFFLFAMLFGARWAIAAAVVAVIVALVKHVRVAAVAFVVAGALAAIGSAPSTAVLFIASTTFGVGLAFAARAYAQRHASGDDR